MAGQSEPAINILDGYVPSWDKLPVLPDIKLLNTQYDEIKSLVEKNQPVELEFDIRNWFKMGPIKYHNVVATIRGSQYPDEYVVMGGHFDCFSGGTGGVDDGNGFSPSMEALRLIKAAGGKPKRSIIVILFAAEENGLVGSQAWLKKHPEIAPKVVMMINRDGSPMALTGVRVPETWYADFQKIAAPLANAFPKWPFKVEKALPRAHATSPGGTDSSSFEMLAVPTLSFMTQTDYVYGYAWHTLNDLYSELVPYTEQQQESAVVHAVMAYGAANLDKPLTRAGVYLDDGIYASVAVGAPGRPIAEAQQFMVGLDFANAPLQTANFMRIVEGNAPAAGGGRGGAGGGGRGGVQPEPPPIGKLLLVKNGVANGEIVSDLQKKFAVRTLPKQLEPDREARRARRLRHDVAERLLPDAQGEPGLRQKVHGARPRDCRGRRRRATQTWRRDPPDPDHARRPGRAGLQDRRRDVQEAARGRDREEDYDGALSVVLSYGRDPRSRLCPRRARPRCDGARTAARRWS